MTWTDNYLDVTADLISDIHVIIEGAIALFENDTDPSFTCAPRKKNSRRAQLSTISAARCTPCADT